MPFRSQYKLSGAKAFAPLLYEHFPYLIVIFAYLIAGFVVENIFERDSMMYLTWRYRIISFICFLYFIILFSIKIFSNMAHTLACLIEKKTGHKRIKHHSSERIFTVERVGGFVIIYATVPIFLSIFSNLKQSIPLILPFSWDRFFMKMDRVLHGGHHPWTLLQPFLGHPDITKAIDYLYVSWFLFLFSILIWMGWSKQRRLRARFFLSFVLIWILIGTVLATLFSSAGPCYYSTVLGEPGPYRPLMSYLDSIHENSFLFARKYQRDVWEAYARNISLPFGGISAMPSVHVATAVLFAFAGWSSNRILGIVLTVYALFIQLGSVHLGWHYAVDGYFSALLTYLIWKFSDPLLEQFLRLINRGISGKLPSSSSM